MASQSAFQGSSKQSADLLQPVAVETAIEIPIYVINLDRSLERLAHISGELERKHLHPIRVRAVDAIDPNERTIEETFDEQRARRAYFVPMHRREVACFLSHRRAWQTFLTESTAPLCVVLEDDAQTTDDFLAVVQAVASRGSHDWDMVKLFARRRQAARDVAPLVRGHRLIRHLRQPTGTVGQIVSRAGAEKLLANSERIYRPLDVQVQHWWEFDLRILSVDPPVVREVSSDLGGSTLTLPRSRRALKPVSRTWRRLVFRSGLLGKSVFHLARQGVLSRLSVAPKDGQENS